MKLLDSEFKLARENIKKYGNETTSLELNIQQLGEKITLQTKKVELSKTAYDNAVSSGTATEKQLDRLKQNYINNQTTLSRFNNELSDCKEKLLEAEKSLDSIANASENVDAKMKLLDAEYKLAKEKVKAYADEQTNLELDMQHLNEKIQLQTRNVEYSKTAYDKAVASGKESEEQLDRLKQKYINSQTKLEELNNELLNCKDKLSDAKQAMNLMLASDTLPDIIFNDLMTDSERYMKEGIIRDLTAYMP
jgi:chromosome segregation ATPase